MSYSDKPDEQFADDFWGRGGSGRRWRRGRGRERADEPSVAEELAGGGWGEAPGPGPQGYAGPPAGAPYGGGGRPDPGLRPVGDHDPRSWPDQGRGRGPVPDPRGPGGHEPAAGYGRPGPQPAGYEPDPRSGAGRAGPGPQPAGYESDPRSGAGRAGPDPQAAGYEPGPGPKTAGYELGRSAHVAETGVRGGRYGRRPAGPDAGVGGGHPGREGYDAAAPGVPAAVGRGPGGPDPRAGGGGGGPGPRPVRDVPGYAEGGREPRAHRTGPPPPGAGHRRPEPRPPAAEPVGDPRGPVGVGRLGDPRVQTGATGAVPHDPRLGGVRGDPASGTAERPGRGPRSLPPAAPAPPDAFGAGSGTPGRSPAGLDRGPDDGLASARAATPGRGLPPAPPAGSQRGGPAGLAAGPGDRLPPARGGPVYAPGADDRLPPGRGGPAGLGPGPDDRIPPGRGAGGLGPGPDDRRPPGRSGPAGPGASGYRGGGLAYGAAARERVPDDAIGGPPGAAAGYAEGTAQHPGYAEPRRYGDDGYIDPYGEDDDEYDEYYEDDALENGKPRRRRWLIVLAVVALVFLVVAFAGWMWVQRQIDPPGGQGETVTVEIEEGSSTGDIGDALAEADVIANATVWEWYARLRNVGSIQAGQYELRENSSIPQAVEVLREGPAAPPGRFVTLPEGMTVRQMISRIADPEDGIEGFSAERLQELVNSGRIRSQYLPRDVRSMEGTLFPETYRLEEGEDESVLLTRMVEQFDRVMGELDIEARAQALGRTPYEILTIASMIEKETGVDEERAQVARVIYNRLAEPMPLGIDATSCYELREDPCRLTTADLESDSPYNTRQNQGLPPTPIASPGRASIEAALNPADGDWLYYVLDAEANDGTHVFTSSYDEFLAARERCQDAGLC